MAAIKKGVNLEKKTPVYKNTKVLLIEDESCVAEIDLNHEDMLYRSIKLKEDSEGVYVEYPTRPRVKNGRAVFDRYGQQFIDYIFRPINECAAYYDTMIVNAYYKAKGLSEISMDDIPFNDETRVLSVCAVNQMHNGFVGFAEVIYRGMMINDIAILQTPAGDKHLVLPHFKVVNSDGEEVKKLFIYPQKEEMQKLRKLVIDSYLTLVR